MADFRRIRNVRRLPEPVEAYLCTLDLKLPGEVWETAEYCARAGDGYGIGPLVLSMIRAGQFEGEITDFEPNEVDRWLNVRERRNDLLDATDHYARADVWEYLDVEERRQIAEYRQALRDIPQHFARPEDVVFPDVPEAITNKKRRVAVDL